GGLGEAPARLSRLFVARASIEDGGRRGSRRAAWAQGFQPPVQVLAVQGARALTRADMVRNTGVPEVQVPLDGSPVLVNGVPATLSPASQVPLGQLYHFA
ncbi:MAG: urease subunit alpha, partial [Streptosporangiaceae bacterium]